MAKASNIICSIKRVSRRAPFIAIGLALTAGAGILPSHARTLHYATPAAPLDDPTTNVLRWWTEEVERRTNGSIEIEIHWLQSLIKYQESADGVRSGIADISPMNPQYTEARMPLWSLSQTELGSGDHYVASQAWHQTVEAFDDAFEQEMKRNGLKNLWHYTSGPRVFISSTRPYKVPEDFQGDKVRLTPRSVQAAKLENWPVTPVNISFAGLYSALERGTIDGAQSYLTLIHSYKQQEVIDYAVEPGIGQSMIVVNMNRRVWESFSDEEQQVFNDIADEIRQRFAQAGVKKAKTARDRLENDPKYPVEHYKLNAKQRDVWEEAYAAAVQKHVKQVANRNPAAENIHRYFIESLKEVEQEVQENGYSWEDN